MYSPFETLLLIRGGIHAEVALQNPTVDLLNGGTISHSRPQCTRIQISPHLGQFSFFLLAWLSRVFAILMSVKPCCGFAVHFGMMGGVDRLSLCPLAVSMTPQYLWSH